MPPPPRPIAPSGSRGVVLVVDDVARNVRMVSAILEAEGYEVPVATDGPHALSLIEARPPDLVLLDLRMPGMDGLEVCRQLKQRPESMDVPVIFLTAAHETELAAEVLAEGAVDFIAKPFHAPELLARVRTHMELKHTRDELRKIIGEKSELMSAVAHDLKNPLSAIRFSALMLRTPPPDAAYRELVESLVETCDSLLRFIQDRLERSARDSQGGHLSGGPVKFDDVLSRVVQQNLPAAAAKGTELDLVVADGPPEIVEADQLGLCQVLDNLVSNGLKFSPAGSRVTLKVESPDPAHLLVSVEDAGPGLSSEDREHLFEPYRRLSARPTGGETSTGLGLSIARRLMERMGGEIGCESSAGQGARFWIKVKRCHSRPERSAQA